MLNIDQLIHQFNLLKSDKRLDSVMNKEANSKLQLWILEIHEETRISQRLLYSWVIPTNYCDNEWYKQDLKVKWDTKSKSFKPNIKKYTFSSNGDVISSLILELLKGESLEHSCTRLNITKPKKEISKLTINQSPNDTYIIRPPIFLETKSLIDLYREEVHPIQSPSHDMPCISASLFHLKKMNIWGKHELLSVPLDNINELARSCINTLKKETGFKFDGEDCSRIGNIEWLSFPLLDKENPPVKFIIIEETGFQQSNHLKFGEIKVVLQSQLKLPNSSLLIRSRIRNNNEIVLDQIKLVTVKEAEEGLKFSANQPISRVQLTVWISNSDNQEWEILYDQEESILQKMQVNMGLVELNGTAELSTLNEWRNSKKSKEKIQKYEKIKPVNYHQSTPIESGYNPWIDSSEVISQYVKQLFPAKSKGRFFPKGWGDNNDVPSALSFAEWFKSITNNTNQNVVTM